MLAALVTEGPQTQGPRNVDASLAEPLQILSYVERWGFGDSFPEHPWPQPPSGVTPGVT